MGKLNKKVKSKPTDINLNVPMDFKIIPKLEKPKEEPKTEIKEEEKVMEEKTVTTENTEIKEPDANEIKKLLKKLSLKDLKAIYFYTEGLIDAKEEE